MRDDVTTLAPHAGETIRVELGARSYDIVIGEHLLDAAGGFIAAALPGARCAVVSDANVAALYLDRLKASLGGLFLGDMVVPPGEQSKSFPVLAQVCERLLTLGVERGDTVVALGGGVVGDLAGFAASILRRGVRLVQMPTTLLAQVDSSVGGKTGIDTPQGKNLIGTFHQPSLVLADISVLATLAPRADLAANLFRRGKPSRLCHRHERQGQGGDRRGRRARGERRPRSAQPRPHVRPRA
jgi:3-dehydroquinate synthetase